MPTTQYVETTLRTFWRYDKDTIMSTRQADLTPLQVGDTKSLTLEAFYSNGPDVNQKRALASAAVLVIDTDHTTSGTATSAGTTATLVDTALTEANDFWIGVPISITEDGVSYGAVITDFVQSTHTLTFTPIPVATTTSSTYVLAGYPMLPSVAATVSTNLVTIDVTGADVTARPCTANVLLTSTFDDGDIETFVGRLRVYQNLFT